MSVRKSCWFCHVSVRQRKSNFLSMMISLISDALLLRERVFNSMNVWELLYVAMAGKTVMPSTQAKGFRLTLHTCGLL